MLVRTKIERPLGYVAQESFYLGRAMPWQASQGTPLPWAE